MNTSAPLHEILYASTMAANAPLSIVADIAARARITNQSRQITGLLVFDGMRFCQQLEGSYPEVATLIARIRRDPRHGQLEILHEGPLAGRRFKRFSLGYTSHEDVDALERLAQLRGQAALDAFISLLPNFDTDL